jgi:hypothetical protein
MTACETFVQPNGEATHFEALVCCAAKGCMPVLYVQYTQRLYAFAVRTVYSAALCSVLCLICAHPPPSSSSDCTRQ